MSVARPAFSKTLSFDPGTSHGRESFDDHGTPYVVEWLKPAARLPFHNPGAAGPFVLQLGIATTSPRRLTIRVNGRDAHELLVTKALWADGFTDLALEIAAGEGENLIELAGDGSEHLGDGREVTFLVVGDVKAFSRPRDDGGTLDWLSALPTTPEGFAEISAARPFLHDEALYDAQYADEPDLDRGRGVVALLRGLRADFSRAALEVGCGTGTLSLGLAAAKAFPAVLLSDPSPAFLELTKKKLEEARVDTSRVRFAVLLAEDIGRLPDGAFSLVVLRSALHHVLHVDAFLSDAARTLVKGGVVAFEEPCAEGYVLMGTLAKFLPLLGETAGRKLTDAQLSAVEVFTNAMRYYARKDVDKADGEDKHIFRFRELSSLGARVGLTVEFFPNVTFDDCATGRPSKEQPTSFFRFFHDYLKFCMSWDEELLGLVDERLLPYCEDLELLAKQGRGPEMHGVFVCRKS